MTQTLTQALDLRKTYPRSPNEALGNFVILPRAIDKCRATVAGTAGEYTYNCPLDQEFFSFVGVDAEAFKEEVAKGKSDEELLAWVEKNAKPKTTEERLAWSYTARWRRPTEAYAHFFEELRLVCAPNNYQIETWFQLLDADEKRLK